MSLAAAATAYRSGLGSGLFYGILVAIAIFQLLAALTMKDPTLFWYVGWILATIGIDLTRDGLLPITNAAAEHTLLLLNLCATACSVGFVATYLKLFSESRRLFWVLILGNALMTCSITLVGIITRAPVTIFVVFDANSIGLGVAIVAAVLRRRVGFLPATYVIFGVLGLLSVFVSKVVRDAAQMPSPFFDRWALAMGSVFDFSVFSLGLVYRSRFTQSQRQKIGAGA